MRALVRDETRLPRAKPKASRDALAATRFSFLFEAQGKSALESSSPISLLNFHIDFLVDADTCECLLSSLSCFPHRVLPVSTIHSATRQLRCHKTYTALSNLVIKVLWIVTGP